VAPEGGRTHANRSCEAPNANTVAGNRRSEGGAPTPSLIGSAAPLRRRCGDTSPRRSREEDLAGAPSSPTRDPAGEARGQSSRPGPAAKGESSVLPCRGPLRPPPPARMCSRRVPRGRRSYPPGAEGSAPPAGTHALSPLQPPPPGSAGGRWRLRGAGGGPNPRRPIMRGAQRQYGRWQSTLGRRRTNTEPHRERRPPPSPMRRHLPPAEPGGGSCRRSQQSDA
jgi:hypothetical protein